jgi:hypothetical protein
MLLEPDQPLDPVFSRKAAEGFCAMLGDALYEIGCDA